VSPASGADRELAMRVAPAGGLAQRGQPERQTIDAKPAPGAGNGRVLIVDDDPSILRMLRLIFLADGYDVTTATNGREALDAVAAAHPGAIVLDLEMPVMDGRQFFRELRAKGNQTPVLILSAYGAELARRELEAEAFVSKPFEPDYLVQEVEKLLSRS
jgi:DNA-binding response OmpR family regulator